jgi:hypothetical protein
MSLWSEEVLIAPLHSRLCTMKPMWHSSIEATAQATLRQLDKSQAETSTYLFYEANKIGFN